MKFLGSHLQKGTLLSMIGSEVSTRHIRVLKNIIPIVMEGLSC